VKAYGPAGSVVTMCDGKNEAVDLSAKKSAQVQ